MNADRTSDVDFARGRNLATELLRAAAAAYQLDGDLTSVDVTYRDGAAQSNVALPFLQRLVAHPELIEGFAAVLTDGLAGGFPDVEVYERLSVAAMRSSLSEPSFRAFIAGVERGVA